MQSEQEKVIEQYLQIETNYAVVVNGEYGIGKTYFFKKILSPYISTISLPEAGEKKYRPIHISLFGLTSIADVQSAIFAELYPILKKTQTKITIGIFKAIFRGMGELSGLGNIDDYVSDIKPDTGDLIRFNELVICFDDVDRKSDSLTIKEIFGFINTLVENEGAKIIIIANESHFKEEEKYTTNREKVVGISIEYTPKTSETYQQIINDRYKDTESLYYKFLQDHTERIVTAIEANHSNFRNLIFFLEYFKIIFKELEIAFGFNGDFSVQKEEKYLAVLNFTLAVAIEFKIGNLKTENFSDLKKVNAIVNDRHVDQIFGLKEKEEKKSPTFIEVFHDKYFPEGNKYYYFNSLLNYIVGRKSFDIQDLKKEINGYWIIEDGHEAEHVTTFKGLGWWDFLNLSDKDYRKKTFKMIQYAEEGLYTLNDYLTVFYFSVRFDNKLNLDLDKLKKRLKKGIMTCATTDFYHDLAFHLHIQTENPYHEHAQEIIEYMVEANNKLYNQNLRKQYIELEEIFASDNQSFIRTMYNKDYELKYKPVLSNFNVRKAYKTIKSLSNEHIWKLAQFFKSRYPHAMYNEVRQEEQFVVNLLALINAPSKKRDQNTIQNHCINHLRDTLTSSLPNFTS